MPDITCQVVCIRRHHKSTNFLDNSVMPNIWPSSTGLTQLSLLHSKRICIHQFYDPVLLPVSTHPLNSTEHEWNQDHSFTCISQLLQLSMPYSRTPLYTTSPVMCGCHQNHMIKILKNLRICILHISIQAYFPCAHQQHPKHRPTDFNKKNINRRLHKQKS